MTKTVFKGLRLSEQLDAQLNAAARERGMNWSEFVRHVLTGYFFGQPADSNRQDDDPSPEVAEND